MLFSAVVVEFRCYLFEQLLNPFQMVKSLTEPRVPISHYRRHAEVNHEADPEGDEK
jgi:hypothetical protein